MASSITRQVRAPPLGRVGAVHHRTGFNCSLVARSRRWIERGRAKSSGHGTLELTLGLPLVLAHAVTIIEVGLIISTMVSCEPNLALLRDSVHAVVVLVLHGLAGVCIVVGAFRERESEFQVAFIPDIISWHDLRLVYFRHTGEERRGLHR